MTRKHDAGSTRARLRAFLSLILIGGGIALLIGSGALVYPYLRSRLVRLPAPAAPPPPPASTPTVSFLPLIEPPTATPADAEGAASAPGTSPPTGSTAAISTPTPTPAVPTRIVIPAIEVDAPVVDVSLEPVQIEGQTQSVWAVPGRYAAGWHDSSAPLGVPGNTVLNGHNTTNGEVFRDLYTLKEGDAVAVYSDEIPYTYAVSEILILPEAGQPLEVRLENARYILATGDERLTLVTCHPYGSLRYRLIVVAFPARSS